MSDIIDELDSDEHTTESRTLMFRLTAPAGTNSEKLADDILDIGWDCLHDRGGDDGWQETHPHIFDGSPDDEVIDRVSFGHAREVNVFEAVEKLLESGSDEGREGTVVVDAKHYFALQALIAKTTGRPCGLPQPEDD